ncbi:MAG: PH domain-containing protein [Proteobacteria bacterium]|nr:PH domain-containing protein [Pseudomonadota bacterium]
MSAGKAETAKSKRDGAVSMLRDGEKLVRQARIHNGIYWKASVVFILALFLMTKVFNLGAFLMLVALLMFFASYLTKHYLLLALTDKRVLVRHGVVKLNNIQMHHSKIESVEVEHPPMGRILGYGSLLITGTGSQITAVPYVNAKDAEAFRGDLDQIIFDREEGKTASAKS